MFQSIQFKNSKKKFFRILFIQYATVIFILRSDEVRFIIKDILDNTLFNLISEATFGEISLTNRPQLISAPPNLGEDPR